MTSPPHLKYNLAASPLFTARTDPVTGITVYLLTHKIAPVQEAFYFVNDANERFYRGGPSTVNFLNRRTQHEERLLSNPEMPGLVGSNYHIDPHPRFVGGEKYVVFTTTVRGEVDLAIIPTSDLIELTS